MPCTYMAQAMEDMVPALGEFSLIGEPGPKEEAMGLVYHCILSIKLYRCMT